MKAHSPEAIIKIRFTSNSICTQHTHTPKKKNQKSRVCKLRLYYCCRAQSTSTTIVVTNLSPTVKTLNQTILILWAEETKQTHDTKACVLVVSFLHRRLSVDKAIITGETRPGSKLPKPHPLPPRARLPLGIRPDTLQIVWLLHPPSRLCKSKILDASHRLHRQQHLLPPLVKSEGKRKSPIPH